MYFFPPLIGLKPSSKFEEPLRIDLAFIELVRNRALNARRLWKWREKLVLILRVNGSDDGGGLLDSSAVERE